MRVSVGVYIGHTAVATFYISLVKTPMKFVMRRKCLSKRFENNFPIFVFVLNVRLNHICCFLLCLILFTLMLLLSFLGRL